MVIICRGKFQLSLSFIMNPPNYSNKRFMTWKNGSKNGWEFYMKGIWRWFQRFLWMYNKKICNYWLIWSLAKKLGNFKKMWMVKQYELNAIIASNWWLPFWPELSNRNESFLILKRLYFYSSWYWLRSIYFRTLSNQRKNSSSDLHCYLQ